MAKSFIYWHSGLVQEQLPKPIQEHLLLHALNQPIIMPALTKPPRKLRARDKKKLLLEETKEEELDKYFAKFEARAKLRKSNMEEIPYDPYQLYIPQRRQDLWDYDLIIEV